MKSNEVPYTAPVCITLAGGDTAQFSEPVLMMAVKADIKVSATSQKQKKGSFSDHVRTALCDHYPDRADIPYFLVSTRLPEDYIGVQAGIIAAISACFVASADGKRARKAPGTVQNVAYMLEKKFLKRQSHAQTTTCLQGGLIFYRKEFEFYKTVLKIPAKIPPQCMAFMNVPLASERKRDEIPDTEKYIRRLVFAIMSENMKLFEETFDTTRADIPSEISLLAEDHKGVIGAI